MTWLFWYNLVGWAIMLTMIPVILRRRFLPSTTLMWLVIIFFLPILGLILYLLLGFDTLGRRRRHKHREVIRRKRASPPIHLAQDDPLTQQMRERQAPMMISTERVFGMPITDGNEVELLSEYESFVDRFIEDIDAARDHVHLIMYIFESDETGRRVANSLIQASSRGVACRVLADAAGSRGLFASGALADELREAGVEVVAALPVSLLRRRLARFDLRNHRKLAVIDGRVAYTGSHNIINRLYPGMKRLELTDLSARFKGPVVAQAQVVFLEDWSFETDEDLHLGSFFPDLEPAGSVMAQAVPSGPVGPPPRGSGLPADEVETFHRVLLAAINSARSSLVLTTPYLVPDEATLIALSLACYRGVKVTIVTTARSDYRIVSAAARSYFQRLLDYGARIYLFQPGLLHSKTMTVDDSFALLGSANIDIRSFSLNLEFNMLLYGTEVTNRLRAIQDQYIAGSIAINREEWRSRPLWQRFTEDAAAVLSPLL